MVSSLAFGQEEVPYDALGVWMNGDGEALVISRNGSDITFQRRTSTRILAAGTIKMEKGELPEESAVREVEEECGVLEPKITDKICETFHTYLYKGVPTLKKTYWYSMAFSGAKDVTPQIEEGITEVVWFKEKEISKIKENTYLSIIDVLNQKFEKES